MWRLLSAIACVLALLGAAACSPDASEVGRADRDAFIEEFEQRFPGRLVDDAGEHEQLLRFAEIACGQTVEIAEKAIKVPLLKDDRERRQFAIMSLTRVCQPPKDALVTRDEFDDDWPLDVERGSIRGAPLDNGDAILLFQVSDGTQYKLNGLASQTSAEVIDAIWSADPDIPGAKVSIGPLITRGLEIYATG